MTCRVSLASPRSVRVHDARKSLSRVARFSSDASIGCCVVLRSGISHLPSRPRAFAARAAVSSSSFERPASSAASPTTSAPAFAAASSRLMYWALNEASCSFRALSFALSASDSLAPERTKRRW